MVAYQDWIRICFDVAEARGFEFAQPNQRRLSSGGRGFSPDNPNASAMEVFGAYWSENSETLASLSESEAREVAEREIQI